jgi:hypothetical protein
VQVLQNVNVLRKFSQKFDSAAVRYASSLLVDGLELVHTSLNCIAASSVHQ